MKYKSDFKVKQHNRFLEYSNSGAYSTLYYRMVIFKISINFRDKILPYRHVLDGFTWSSHLYLKNCYAQFSTKYLSKIIIVFINVNPQVKEIGLILDLPLMYSSFSRNYFSFVM